MRENTQNRFNGHPFINSSDAARYAYAATTH